MNSIRFTKEIVEICKNGDISIYPPASLKFM